MTATWHLRPESPRSRGLSRLIGVILLLVSSHTALAHDPPEEYFDRNILVTPEADGVRVRYRLELSQFSLFRLPDRDKQIETKSIKDRASLEAACLKRFELLIPDQLLGFLNKQPLDWTIEKTSIEQKGSTHFRLDLHAKWKLKPGENTFEIIDANFDDAPGPYRLKLETANSVEMMEPSEPKEWLGKGVDPHKDHKASALLTITGGEDRPAAHEPSLADAPAEPEPTIWQRLHDDDLTALLTTRFGLGLMLLLALVHGAGHSMMPGHGKTMVAAYLVGERGTPGHAVLLGVVTTLTHTSAAIGVAILLRYGIPGFSPESVNRVLMFLGGLTMTVVGVWLFLQRLAGRSDHVHLVDVGGHSHGSTPEPLGRDGFIRLVLLGIAGGIIPCWGAIMWVIGCIATGQFWLALPIVVAFSVGLASVLILIGLSVVYAGRLGSSRWSERSWFKAIFNERTRRVIPVVGAALVVVIGLFLCATSGVAAK